LWLHQCKIIQISTYYGNSYLKQLAAFLRYLASSGSLLMWNAVSTAWLMKTEEFILTWSNCGNRMTKQKPCVMLNISPVGREFLYDYNDPNLLAKSSCIYF